MRTSTLQDEIKQRRPFRSERHEAAVALARTADVVRRHFAGVLAPHDLTPQQFNVLRILRGAGAEGLPTMEIGRRMLERTPGTTRLIDRLIAKRWVVREASEGDRRRVVCKITPKGLGALARADGPIADANEHALAVLGRDEVRKLIELLHAIRAGLLPEPE